MGENGAGKSTLMKILMGLETADSGEIIFAGEVWESHDVRDSLAKGISMIHQELQVVPELTVAENIFLGRENDPLADRLAGRPQYLPKNKSNC